MHKNIKILRKKSIEQCKWSCWLGRAEKVETKKEGKNFRNNVARFDRLNVKQGSCETRRVKGKLASIHPVPEDYLRLQDY